MSPFTRRLMFQRWPILALGIATATLTTDRVWPAGADERQTLSGESVAIYDLAGEVRVEPGTGSAVVVTISRGGKDAGALRVHTGAVGATQTLSVEFPADHVVYADGEWHGRSQVTVARDGRFGNESDWSFGGRSVTVSDRGAGLDAHADLTIQVSPGRRLAIHLLVGTLNVTNVDGDLRLDTGAASVVTRGTRGALALDTGSGRTRVTDARGALSVDSGSGEVEIHGVHGPRVSFDTGSGALQATDLTADQLSVDSGSGSIDLVEVSVPDIRMDSGSGSVRVDLRPGTRSFELDGGSGDVTIGMPSGMGASFEIQSGSGGVRVAVPHTVLERTDDLLRGRIGDGRAQIRIDAGSGGVRLVPRDSGGGRPGRGLGALLRYSFN
jgi:hypothetical protein